MSEVERVKLATQYYAWRTIEAQARKMHDKLCKTAMDEMLTEQRRTAYCTGLRECYEALKKSENDLAEQIVEESGMTWEHIRWMFGKGYLNLQ